MHTNPLHTPALFSSAFMLMLATGCTDKTQDTATEITYQAVLDDVLMPSCGFSSCHGEGAGFLTISADQTEDDWLALESSEIPGIKLIEPGSASTSYLVMKLEEAEDIVGTVMPPSGMMEQSRIDKIRAWIDSIPE